MTHFHIFTCVYESGNSFHGDEPFTVLRPSTSAYLTFVQNAVVTQDVYLFSLDYFHRRCFLPICGRTCLSLGCEFFFPPFPRFSKGDRKKSGTCRPFWASRLFVVFSFLGDFRDFFNGSAEVKKVIARIYFGKTCQNINLRMSQTGV